MSEPSVVTALRAGFRDPTAYYKMLRSYGGEEASFFDGYLSCRVFVGYQSCQEIYRNGGDFGRSRLTLSDEYFSGCDSVPVLEGYRLLQRMSIFQDSAAASYGPRRQRLLTAVAAAKKSLIGGMINTIASDHIDRIRSREPIDIFSISLRRYAEQCATAALIGASQPPEQVSADALTAAYFFDGKRPSKPYVLNALAAMDRLGDWIAAAHQMSRDEEPDVVADLVLLYVAAHESLARSFH